MTESDLRPISEIAEDLGLAPEEISPYGKLVAKVALRKTLRRRAKLVLVTAINPTPKGEGKTVTSIGLSMGLNEIGRKTVICSRQPSLGPLFGVKGGAAGGGMSTLEPMQRINMRFTGDFDAIASAHNLLAAMIDNHLYQGNEAPKFDPKRIVWKRTLDVNDRSLRRTLIGVGEKREGVEREDGFVITAASEVMTTLCLSKGYADLKERLSRIIVGYSPANESIRAIDLHASGAMAALLRDALQPNLAQTCEGTPALIHGGPFGNIATGTCSLVSMLLGLDLAEYCVVEAGFGSDLGAEKFFDIVSRIGGFNVDAVVIVATVRGLRYHGQSGGLVAGLQNLGKHIENINFFGAKPVVAINKFSSDAREDLELVERFCSDLGVPSAVSDVFEKGGAGAADLAALVVEASKKKLIPRPAYDMDDKIEDKIWKVSTAIYGAKNVEFKSKAKEDLDLISNLGLTSYPICVAKTPFSLSDDPKKLGRPRDFSVTVDDIDIAAGPGFHVVRMGSVLMMPGLPPKPAAEDFDLTDDGRINGVF